MKIRSINPATEEIVQEYETASNEEIAQKIRHARKGFQEWRRTDISERAALLRKVAEVLRKNKDEYARIMTIEMGKPIRESVAEVEKCAWVCEFYADNCKKFLEEELVQTDSKKSFVAFEPLGVVASIMPWNFPFWQVFRFATPTLTAGNVTILKHSSVVPGCGVAIQEAFKEAGFPEHVFQNIIGTGQVAETLIQADVDAVSLTGSVEVGMKVAELASRQLKKFVLELGGSDPFIVLEDADLDAACKGAVQGRVINSGQSCIAAKRFIVVKKIAQEFTRQFAELMKNLKVDDPLDKETQVGPLARSQQRDIIESQVEDAKQAGAKVLTGGTRLNRKGYFYAPTVITDVNPKMRVVKEETFGPVAPIIVVENEQEAIREANNTEFGLGSSIWTQNHERGEKLAREIAAGVVFINASVKSDPRMPFGGIKKSGIGRELSRFGLMEFVNIKTVSVF